jgi:pimeloyl-ACP methyl ester carboxylesterase
MEQPEPLDVPVRGGELRVLRWGTGPRTVVAAHGITATGISWRAVAEQLGGEWSLFAPDLRGRGASAGLPGPWGLSNHADDVLAVVDALDLELDVLAGQSMGAYIAVLAAARRPSVAPRVLLVDGGLPLPVPLEGIDPDEALAATLGPALERLQMTFPDLDAYFDYWRQHPALSAEWNDHLEAYFEYDLGGEDGARRSRCVEEAIRADGRDVLVEQGAIGAALRAVTLPLHLLRAPMGMFGEPPGIQPDGLVDAWRPQVAALTDAVVEGTNHYTILFGERGATAIAEAIACEPTAV